MKGRVASLTVYRKVVVFHPFLKRNENRKIFKTSKTSKGFKLSTY